MGTTDESHIDILLSRHDMASYTGTTYETLFRIINELTEEKAISVDGKNISIIREDILYDYTKTE